MNINTIASGSQGNAILISHNGYNLMLDAGVEIGKMRRALIDSNIRLTNLDGALISHGHLDHCKGGKYLCKLAIDCYMPKDTEQTLNSQGYHTHIAEPLKQFYVNHWKILPFDLPHDVKNLGFLVAIDNKKLLYAVDMAYIPHRFKCLTHILIECNYDLETLRNNFLSGRIDKSRYLRTLKNHMGLETVKVFFRSNDLSQVEEIHLLHISKQNGNPETFKDEIQKLTGKIVKI